MIHLIHMTGGANNHFLTLFHGECALCCKLDAKSGGWSLHSGPEQQVQGDLATLDAQRLGVRDVHPTGPLAQAVLRVDVDHVFVLLLVVDLPAYLRDRVHAVTTSLAPPAT